MQSFIIFPRRNVNGGLAKPPSTLNRQWVIASHCLPAYIYLYMLIKGFRVSTKVQIAVPSTLRVLLSLCTFQCLALDQLSEKATVTFEEIFGRDRGVICELRR